MQEYPKIDNLFKRNPDKKSEIMVGRYTRPEFTLISAWDVTEKVDGTNIRIEFTKNGDFSVRGRSDNAQFSQSAYAYLEEIAAGVLDNVLTVIEEFGIDSLTVYGELYGPKIQRGGNYSSTLGFRSFDMLVNDKVWLAPDDVRRNAERFGLDSVPSMGVMFTQDIVDMVSAGFVSTFAVNREYMAEGVIAKPLYNLYDQRGERVVFKLKTKDLSHAK